MYIAQAKRKENIAEYILYLWQLEDLLRALQFSPEAIYTQLISSRNLEPDQENDLLMWYLEVGNLLKEEGKEGGGHLDHTLHLIADLQELHQRLMTLPEGEKYAVAFAKLAPELPGLRELVAKSQTLDKDKVSDIELCFRALYAVMLYRIKGDEKGRKAIEDVLEVVSPVIAELAAMHKKVESGEIDLFKE